MSPENPDVLFEVRSLPGKGKGIVAVRDIQPGELIIEEKPFILVPWWVRHSLYPRKELLKCIYRCLDEASEADEEDFFDLSDCKSLNPDIEKTEIGIWRTNNFALGRSSTRSSNGLFLRMSRFNHSCVPSAEFHWDEKKERQEVRAIRTIPQGEEITLCYFTSAVQMLTAEERKQYLEKKYGFPCDCVACSMTGDKLEEDDNLRKQIQHLGKEIHNLLYEWVDIDDEDEELESPESSDEGFADYDLAVDLSLKKFELMERLGFKVIARLDALQGIVDTARENGDQKVVDKLFEKGLGLARTLYGGWGSHQYQYWKNFLSS